MDNIESQTSQSAPEGNLSALQDQVSALRQLVNSLLVILLIVSGTLSIFLLRQVKTTGSELKNAQPQVNQMVTDFNRSSAPAISNFVYQLAEYTKTHPDFAPILTKYMGKPQQAAPTPAGSSPPMPAPAQPAKK